MNITYNAQLTSVILLNERGISSTDHLNETSGMKHSLLIYLYSCIKIYRLNIEIETAEAYSIYIRGEGFGGLRGRHRCPASPFNFDQKSLEVTY